MISRLRVNGVVPLLAVLVACLVLLPPAERVGRAQPKPPDLKPNPAAPTLRTAFPAGGQRGTTVEVTFVGTNLTGPLRLWTSFPLPAGAVVFPSEGTNGKNATKLVARITLPADAPIGFHGVRVVTGKGMSNLRLFCIDDLAQVLADGKNGTLATAQKVPTPCCVVGRVENEAKAYFKFQVAAGQALSFELLGRRLGSALDPQLTLFDLKGHELPNGYSNDAPGRLTDPCLRYTFKDAGEYVIVVRDVAYKGGDDFIYRLRIGDFPLATTPIPLAVKRGSTTPVKVSFAGPFTTGVAPVEVTVPTDSFVDQIAVAPKGPSGQYGWPVILTVSDHDEVVEQEPNNEAAKANKVPVPGGVSGRFETRGDVDYYSFAGKKGQKLVLDAQTAEVGSPTEVMLTVRDGKGAQVGASDPMKGPRVEFTPAADGNYTVQAEHLLYWGGPSESYHLTIVPAGPSFDLNVALDRFEIRPGTTLNIPVQVVRRDNPGELLIKVVGTGLTGEVKVNAGKPPAFVTLPIKAANDLAGGPTTFRIVGTITSNGKTITETASTRGALSGQMANLPLPPRPLTRQFGLFVLEPPPFVLTAKLNKAETMPGKNVELTVTAERHGFAGDIALTVLGLPANTKAETKTIAAGQKDVTFPIVVPANAAVGKATLTVQGKVTQAGKAVVLTSPGVPLTVKK